MLCSINRLVKNLTHLKSILSIIRLVGFHQWVLIWASLRILGFQILHTVSNGPQDNGLGRLQSFQIFHTWHLKYDLVGPQTHELGYLIRRENVKSSRHYPFHILIF